MATAEEIATAAAANAEAGISSQATDGVQTTALDPLKQLDVADRLAERTARNKTKLPIRYGKFRPSGGGE